MIDISLGGLIGAFIGTIVSALVYGAVAGFLERRYLASREPAHEDRATQRQELGLLWRGVLALDLLLFCALGYWIGAKISG
jgi:hypothetical protein